ncbi:hypothetical protein HK098_007151 [Nowakowskiella sp. JEL0407]|nr:hypothetical protein HK098_007151 [Nowakowskiella sp. JEL0407]
MTLLTNPYLDPVHEEVFRDRGSQPPLRVIMVAVDPSTHSDFAFHYTLDNIAKPGDQIILLNVRPLPTYPTYGITAYSEVKDLVDNEESDAKSESHKLLKSYASKVLQNDLRCRAIALRGDSREELVNKANELSPSLFVIGSRGLGAFKRTVLGSVSDYAAHHANCAVLVSKKVH